MKYSVILAIFSATFSISLGVFALIKNAKGVQNRNFAYFNIALAVWNIGEISSAVRDPQIALFLYRVTYIGASYVPVFVTDFFWSVANYQFPKYQKIQHRIALFLAIISPTALIIKDITVDLRQLSPIEEVHGLLYYPFILFFVCGLAYSIVPVISVYRRATGYNRNQLRYIAVAVCVGIVGTFTYLASQLYDALPPLYCFFQTIVCATFAVAIFKHRLMDITIIIRKTLIYSGVMVVIAVVYLGIVALFTRLLEGLTGYQTVVSSAVGALLVTLCFQPLRKKIQTFVDAKFFRQYVDREEKLYELSREVITHTTPEAMAKSIIRVLTDTLHPKSAALFLRAKDGNEFVLVSDTAAQEMPERMSANNPLTEYFSDHPQPFVQELGEESGVAMDTRRPPRTEEIG